MKYIDTSVCGTVSINTNINIIVRLGYEKAVIFYLYVCF